MKILITRTHNQMRVARQRDRRVHRRWHLALAAALREEAELNQQQVDEGLVPEEYLEMMEAQIEAMKFRALAEENSKCVSTGGH